MHDRFGYYICWGVLAWVRPCTRFCLIPRESSELFRPMLSAVITGIGLLSLWSNYSADAERQRVRATNGNTTVWSCRARCSRRT